MLSTALLIVAFILFVLAALNVPTGPRVSIGWLGLAFWVLSLLIENRAFH
jgi:hypothetical protein